MALVLVLLAPAVASAAQQPDAVVLETKGYVVAARLCKVNPRNAGEIVWIDPNFREGARFRQGDVLAIVDPSLYKARVDRARANLRSQEVLLEQAKSGSIKKEIEKARLHLTDARALRDLAVAEEKAIKEAGSAVPKLAVDTAVRMRVQAEEKVRAAEAEVEVLLTKQEETVRSLTAQLAIARADLVLAETERDNCSIRAPIAGTVLSKNAELGAYVSPLAFGAAGYLCEMADLSDLEIEVDVPEADIGRLRVGQPCRIMPTAYQLDQTFLKSHPKGYPGVVARVLPQANRARGSLTVRVKVQMPPGEEPGLYLNPDMSAVISFLK
jgi:multidrug resistance efflux pump